MQLNCTYRNYTEAAATCSAAQQHSKFTVQILYKLYSLQLNCTYSNYTEAAATCSAAQQHTKCPDDVFWSGMLPTFLNYTWISMYLSVTSLDRNFQINAAATKNSVTCSQHYGTHPTVPLFEPCVYIEGADWILQNHGIGCKHRFVVRQWYRSSGCY